MDLRLLISLALYCMKRAGARPLDLGGDEGGLQGAISKLQLLKELANSNQLVGDDWLTPKASLKKSRKPKLESDPDGYSVVDVRAPFQQATAPGVPSLESQHVTSHNLYSDGAFSDIPSDAFQLEHRKEFTLKAPNRGGSRVTKKGLNGHANVDPLSLSAAHAHRDDDRPPGSLMKTCLNYFRGKSPKRSSLELVLDICRELVDGNGAGEFALDDDKRQEMYDLRADDYGTHHQHSLGPAVSVDCDLCPHGHHVIKAAALEQDDNDDDNDGHVREDVRSEVLLSDLLELLKPVGNRRKWMVINSKNPDERMRTYVDLKK